MIKEYYPLNLGYKVCPDCHRTIRKGDLHNFKPGWGECEIIRDFQLPIIKIG